jgi:hypothetical protein
MRDKACHYNVVIAKLVRVAMDNAMQPTTTPGNPGYRPPDINLTSAGRNRLYEIYEVAQNKSTLTGRR